MSVFVMRTYVGDQALCFQRKGVYEREGWRKVLCLCVKMVPDVFYVVRIASASNARKGKKEEEEEDRNETVIIKPLTEVSKVPEVCMCVCFVSMCVSVSMCVHMYRMCVCVVYV